MIQPLTFSFLKSFEILAMVVLGGLGSITGCIIGAGVMTIVSALLADFPELRMVIIAILLIILMIFRPNGIMGNKEFKLNFLNSKRKVKRMALLKVEKLSKSFSGLKAVSNLDMEIEAGELVGLIGPNGAGKTTVFNLLTGVYTPTEGMITFQDRKMNGLPPYKVSHLGMARTFQNIRLFGDLTVIDNV